MYLQQRHYAKNRRYLFLGFIVYGTLFAQDSKFAISPAEYLKLTFDVVSVVTK